MTSDPTMEHNPISDPEKKNIDLKKTWSSIPVAPSYQYVRARVQILIATFGLGLSYWMLPVP